MTIQVRSDEHLFGAMAVAADAAGEWLYVLTEEFLGVLHTSSVTIHVENEDKPVLTWLIGRDWPTPRAAMGHMLPL